MDSASEPAAPRPVPPTLPVATLEASKRFLFAGEVLNVVVTNDDEILGRFVSLDETNMVIWISGEVEAEIPVEDIRRVERVSRRGMEGVVIGAFTGGIPLAIASWMFGDWARSGADYYYIIFALGAIPIVGGLAAIGGLFGAAIKRRAPVFVAPGPG